MREPAAPPPIRAQLVRIVPPNDARFPHDLLLYPTDQARPEYWNVVWVDDGIYGQFLKQWDRKTCPACQTPTMQKSYEKKYMGDLDLTRYSSWVSYDTFVIYVCATCRCGWTERTGSESFVDTSFP